MIVYKWLNYIAAAKLGEPRAQNNLALLYFNGKGVPQDKSAAFQLCLDAARHGNTTAQANVGMWYLNGTGVFKDIETGIAWLKAAAEGKNAPACRLLGAHYTDVGDKEQGVSWYRRGAELGDAESQQWFQSHSESPAQGSPEYLRRLSLPMPPVDRVAERLCQRKELYSGFYFAWNSAVVGGKLYYLYSDWDETLVCVSELDGGGARILARIADFPDVQLAANATGLYIYTIRDDDQPLLRVKKLELTGRVSGEYTAATDDRKGVCLYDTTIYYTVCRAGKCQLCALDTAQGRNTVLYQRANEIDQVYAGRLGVVFHAHYETDDESPSGWMLYDPDTKAVRCLDSTLSPELILDHPEYFDWQSPAYREDVSSRRIVFFDLARDLLWTQRTVQENGGDAIYLEPRPLLGGWDLLVPNAPIWRFNREQWDIVRHGTSYFDGERMYAAPDYWHFYGCDRTGKVRHWDMSHGHGCCEEFFVAGDRLFLDVDARGEKVYPAAVEPSAPLGNSWRKTVPTEEAPHPKDVPVQQPRQAATGGSQPGDMSTDKTISATDVKYGILTFGSKFHMGFGISVTLVYYDGSRYSAKTHNSAKGRVDGLKRFFAEKGLQQGEVLSVRYAAGEQTIYVEYVIS